MDEDQMLWLLNSSPTVDGQVQELLTDDQATTTLVQHLGGHPGPSAVESLRAVRDDLQRVVRGDEDEDVLARHLAGVGGRPELSGGTVHWQPDFSAANEVAARVVLAWGEIATRHPGRVRACANDECSKFLLDRSRPNSGRWCSMAECGNRLKARRHSARRSTPASES